MKGRRHSRRRSRCHAHRAKRAITIHHVLSWPHSLSQKPGSPPSLTTIAPQCCLASLAEPHYNVDSFVVLDVVFCIEFAVSFSHILSSEKFLFQFSFSQLLYAVDFDDFTLGLHAENSRSTSSGRAVSFVDLLFSELNQSENDLVYLVLGTHSCCFNSHCTYSGLQVVEPVKALGPIWTFSLRVLAI